MSLGMLKSPVRKKTRGGGAVGCRGLGNLWSHHALFTYQYVASHSQCHAVEAASSNGSYPALRSKDGGFQTHNLLGSDHGQWVLLGGEHAQT